MELLRPRGKIRRPTAEELKALAAAAYIRLSDEELRDIGQLSDELLTQFDIVDELPESWLPQQFPHRDRGHRPARQEDPYNIFVTKCHVKGADHGCLLGKKVGLKDNISLQGVPMTNGSRVGQGYIPNVDATVVTRLLAEGAVIVGKLNMDDMSYSGTSETSFYGAVRNPRNPDYSPAGSSSGSGAAVANGDVDIAIAVDQGGSARMPAAWCGVTSIKATHGLVPSFGIPYMDHTVDHVCPITRTAAELAEVLEVIAGEDENDPQWVRGPIRVDQYTKHLVRNVKGVRIGLVREGLEWPSSEDDVNEAVRSALEKIGTLGTEWKECSIPLFRHATAIWTAILIPSSSAMIESDGDGFWHGGYYNTHWNAFFGAARRARSSDLPPLLKLAMIVGKYMRTEYYGLHHAKAQNLRRQLRAAIDQALAEYDVLALPTTPMKPLKLEARISFKEMARKAVYTLNNCCPFNLTGHPAISIPCAMRQGLPIGLQLVAKHFDEGLLFRVAHTFEAAFDWHKL